MFNKNKFITNIVIYLSMRKFIFLLLIVLGCQDEEIGGILPANPTADAAEILSVSFKSEYNPSITQDINLEFNGIDTFSAHIPFEVDIFNLVASVAISQVNATVLLDNDVFENEVTPHNFGKEVIISAINTDESITTNYKIRLTYFTGLPILYINTDNSPIVSKTDYVLGFSKIYGGLNFDDLELASMKIRGRGNSTWMHPKKPYQIEFDNKTTVLGMPDDRRWILLAEYSDKTLLRNKLTFEMGALSHLNYTPSAEFVELFINNVHQGTYLVAQKVEKTNNRVPIGDEGFLVEIDQDYRIAPDDVYFTPTIYTQNYPSNVFNIKDPEVQLDSSEYQLIESHINNFESALFGPNFTDPDSGYRSYIDVDSFVDWFLINEISKTVDAKWFSSIYFTYSPGGKIKMGPLWDFDLSYGNVDYADPEYPEGFWIKENLWISRMFEDPYFQNQVQTRFEYFYNSLDYFHSFIDSSSIYLDDSQTRNYDTWQTLGTYVWPNPVWYDTYQEEVNHLKQWLTIRLNWLAQEL